MKLQKLIIKNIASIENAEIDFEARPLSETDVFLISGKTGSGKTTLLDAICLALFSDTPRLKNLVNSKVRISEEFNVTADNPAQLLRKGAGEGYITLFFKGNNGIDYEVNWYIARAYKKPDGKFQQKQWTLKNLFSGHSLTKSDEVAKEITLAVGLDFTQFCRTTMLAQGDFSRFINSKDEDKASILEKITGTDVYSKIGMKIYEITGERKKKFEDASEKIKNISLLSPEQLSELTANLKSYDSKFALLASQRDHLLKKIDWLLTIRKLNIELEHKTREFNEITTKVSQPEFAEMRKLTHEWQETSDARAYISAIDENRQKIRNTKSEIDVLSQDTRNFLDEYGYSLISPNKDADESEVLTSLDASLTSAANVISSLIEINKEKKLPNLRNNINRLTEEISLLTIAQVKLKSYLELKEEIKEGKKTLETTRQNILVLENDFKTLGDTLKLSKERLDTVTKIYESQKDTVNKFSVAMRSHLHVGDTCPVCRQKIKEVFDSEQNLKAMIEELKNEKEKAEINYKSVESNYNKTESKLTVLRQSALNAEKLVERNETNLRARLSEAHEACRKCKIENFSQVSMSLPGELKEGREKDLCEIKEKEDKVLIEIKGLETQLNICNKILNKTKNLTFRIQDVRKDLENKNKQLNLFFEGYPDYSEEKIRKLSLFSVKQIKSIEENLKETETKLIENKTNLENIKLRIERHIESRPEISEEDTEEILSRMAEEVSGELKYVGEQKGIILQQIETDRKNRVVKEEAIKDVEEKEKEFRKWEKLNMLFGSADGKKFRMIAQSYVLESLVNSANYYMSALSGRYILKVHPGEFIIYVEDAYRGYSLRSVGTLSGGETFLVSLALALALSEISEKLAVDTLFIDEGFGTLSGEPLSKAIETLRTLHSTSGKQVGIISHIEELKEKIPVRIQVESEGLSGKSSVSIIP